MNFLFFDIECANNADGIAKICEFGYVLINDNFDVLEKDNFIIDPKAPFDWYVIKKLLAYKKEAYYNSEPYPFYFDKISSLFNAPDTMVVGHSVDGDARYLNDEAKRYKLPFFKYDFYDIRIIYQDYTKAKNGMGLEQIGETIGSEKPKHAHTAVDDAEATMYIAKKLCEDRNITLVELLKKYPNAVGTANNGLVTTVEREENAKRRKESGKDNKLYGENYKKFYHFLSRVKPNGKIIESELNGKKLSITPNYQRMHFHEMMEIVQLLKNRNCMYETRNLDIDYFVTWECKKKDGSIKPCDKTRAILDLVKQGKPIKVITFEELLTLLDVDEEKLH